MSVSLKIFNVIQDIRRTNRRTAKVDLLIKYQHSVMLRQILYHTYTPYLRFHIRKIPPEIVGTGWEELGHTTWALLGKLATRKLSGLAARESLFAHMEKLSAPAAIILRHVILKDLRCGIAAATINLVFPNLVPSFECQLVEDWDPKKAVWPMLASPKLDGVRGEFREGKFYSRRGHKIGGLDHIVRYLSSVASTYAYSGELFIPGMNQSRASGIIRTNMDTKPAVRYGLIDVVNMDVATSARYTEMTNRFWPMGYNPDLPVFYIPSVEVHSEEEVDDLYLHWVSQGHEGLVAKRKDCRPKMGRSYDWMRKVGKKSAEYQVINVYESEKMPGRLGGVVIKGNIRVGSGFTQAQRKEYWMQPGLILGKMATILFKEKTKAGSLREPIFKGIRWDI